MFTRIILFLIIGLVFITCNQKETGNGKNKAVSSPPEIEFNKLYHDFGTITEGEKVAYTFGFKNTGGTELIIKDAIAGCGCTIPEYEKKPVKPGEKGYVEIIFDSRGRYGNQYKSILLKTNTPYGEKTLTIKANIVTNKNLI